MSEILNNFCELNIANYTPDDVERLSAWSIDAYDQIRSLEAELAELRKEHSQYKKIYENIHAIIDDSDGVSGYHLNGEIADWDEFIEDLLIKTSNERGEVMIPKYRAWHKEREQMFDVLVINFIDKVVNIENETCTINGESFDQVILMQSTGLHDKNGVEIFDGDLLIYEAKIFTVERIKSGFIPVRNTAFGYERLDGYLIAEAIRIGNIHQNPELLEQ